MVSSKTAIVVAGEVTAETLAGSENLWVVGRGVAGEGVAAVCGDKMQADKDTPSFWEGVVENVAPIILVEEPRSLGSVWVLTEMDDEAEFPSGVSEARCTV